MAELHSITGVFHEVFPGTSPWGGHFIRGIEAQNGIEGSLIDTYGPSQIIGSMTENELNFRKKYVNCNSNQTFEYNFKLENGIWVGNYTVPGSKWGDQALCKTSLVFDGLGFERPDVRTPEQYFGVLIDGMVKAGYLNRHTDPETGEDMISCAE